MNGLALARITSSLNFRMPRSDGQKGYSEVDLGLGTQKNLMSVHVMIKQPNGKMVYAGHIVASIATSNFSTTRRQRSTG